VQREEPGSRLRTVRPRAHIRRYPRVSLKDLFRSPVPARSTYCPSHRSLPRPQQLPFRALFWQPTTRRVPPHQEYFPEISSSWCRVRNWWAVQGLNLRHPACKNEKRAGIAQQSRGFRVSGANGRKGCRDITCYWIRDGDTRIGRSFGTAVGSYLALRKGMLFPQVDPHPQKNAAQFARGSRGIPRFFSFQIGPCPRWGTPSKKTIALAFLCALRGFPAPGLRPHPG
jgi:hypothetical protein